MEFGAAVSFSVCMGGRYGQDCDREPNEAAAGKVHTDRAGIVAGAVITGSPEHLENRVGSFRIL